LRSYLKLQYKKLQIQSGNLFQPDFHRPYVTNRSFQEEMTIEKNAENMVDHQLLAVD